MDTFEKALSAAGLIGLPFSWSENGEFYFGDMPQSEIDAVLSVYAGCSRLADEISSACRRIDSDADAIYQAVMGNRATEYAQAEADASAYKAAGYSGQVPAYVQAWATAKGKTAQWAADDILATAASWRTAQAAIRQNRLASKEAVRKAVTVEEVNTAMATWAGFVTYIKGQLGV